MWPIAEREVAAFRRDGATVVPSAIPPADLHSLRRGTRQLIDRFHQPGFESADYWNYFNAERGEFELYRIHNLETQDWPERELLRASWLSDIAQAFLGTPVKPSVFALVLKQPKVGAPIPWHRDRVNVAPHTVCNLSLCLDRGGPNCGQLE